VNALLAAAKYERWIRSHAWAFRLIPLIALFVPGPVMAASLKPATSQAWDDYIESANTRMEQRLSPEKSFLWVDESPDRRARVRAGEVLVSPVGPEDATRVPAGLIHHWVGAAFIPNITLDSVIQVLGDYSRYKEFYQPTVAESQAISTGETKDRFSMLLINKSLLLRTALDTEYESRHVRIDDRRGYSISRTTRIQEVEEYGTPAQHGLPVGEGSGLIWRLFSIARYAQRDGGVYVELEAIALSRDIPPTFRWLIEPIVRRVSRGSLLTSLQQTENAVRLNAELGRSERGLNANRTGPANKKHPTKVI
jgi:hypothetical protein